MTHRHIKTNQLLSIKKVYGNICVCYIEKPYYIFNNVLVDVCICHKNNLVEINGQLKLF